MTWSSCGDDAPQGGFVDMELTCYSDPVSNMPEFSGAFFRGVTIIRTKSCAKRSVTVSKIPLVVEIQVLRR